MPFLQRVHTLDPIYIFRFGLAMHMLAAFGLGSDFAWHMKFWGEDIYKVAHLVLWAGMAGIVLSLVLMRLRGFYIPMHVFFLFPVWLFLYITTDEILDMYFEINSGTFWTPFRLTFGPMVIYYLYWLYQTHVETNKLIVTYLKTFLFFVLPARFFMFVLIPFAPFSIHDHLHGTLSILVSVAAVFIVGTVYKCIDDVDILLPGLLIFSALRQPSAQFFIDSSNIYVTQGAFWLLFGMLFFMLATRYTTERAYMALAVLTVSLVYFLQYMGHETFSLTAYVLACIAAVIFVPMYLGIERGVVGYMRPKVQTVARLS
jgi:hypothetical protein